MSIDDAEMVREFLTESYENLDRLDRELVSLEKDPQNRDALAGVFRTIHTIKGTCGFLGFGKLEKVAHVGENLLSLLRDGKLLLTPEITTALLAMVDAVRQILGQIQATGQEGNADNTQLLADLTRLLAMGISPESAPAGKPTPPVVQEQAQLVEPEPEALPKPEVVAADPKPEPIVKKEAAAPKPEASPKAESAPAASGASSAAQPSSNDTIRVGVTLLDKLMTLVGELVLARNQLMQPIGNVWSQFPRTVRDVAIGCGKEVVIEMEGKETELDKTIIEAIKDPLTHLVRNSVDHGIELPEARVKAGKPRVGRLTLRAFHEGGQVNIEISDDGAGLNRERIRQKAIERGLMNAEQAARLTDREIFNLIFMAGFSTAEKVTNVSGRGVGMEW